MCKCDMHKKALVYEAQLGGGVEEGRKGCPYIAALHAKEIDGGGLSNATFKQDLILTLSGASATWWICQESRPMTKFQCKALTKT